MARRSNAVGKGSRNGSTPTLDTLCVDALPEGQVAAFGTESGDIYASGDQGRTWNRIATGIGQVTRVLTLP
jgi:hypothetical protein